MPIQAGGGASAQRGDDGAGIGRVGMAGAARWASGTACTARSPGRSGSAPWQARHGTAGPRPKRPGRACLDQRKRAAGSRRAALLHEPDAKLRPDARRLARYQREARAAPRLSCRLGCCRGSGSGRGRLGGGVVVGAVAGAEAHVGFATHFLQEAVVLVFQLAPADGLANLRALVLVAHIGVAAGRPAGRRANRPRCGTAARCHRRSAR